MKMLIVGSGKPWALENWYVDSLKRKSIDLYHFDIYSHGISDYGSSIMGRLSNRTMQKLNRIKLMERLTTHLASNKYDVVMIFKGAELSPQFLEKTRKFSKAIWVNYNPDNPFATYSTGFTNKNILSSIGLYDIYLTWSKDLIEKLYSHGAKKVEYLPFGYSAGIHRVISKINNDPRTIISFVGAWDKDRERLLSGLTDFDLKIYGGNWERVSKNSPLNACINRGNITGINLCKVISDSAISINMLRSQNSGSHNMRTFEIPAMGGLMLTTRSKEQEFFFPEGVGSMMFSSAVELQEKAKLLLSDSSLREFIQKNSSRLVEPHSYDVRVDSLINILKCF